MKMFKFRLQRLLDIRETAEKKIQNELAELLNEQNAVRMRQQGYRDSILKEREEFGKKLREKKADYKDILSFENFYSSASKAIEISEKQIQSMEGPINGVRERLIEATRERKVVVRLKEKKLREYEYELNREIMKENDDANQKIYNMEKSLSYAERTP